MIKRIVFVFASMLFALSFSASSGLDMVSDDVAVKLYGGDISVGVCGWDNALVSGIYSWCSDNSGGDCFSGSFNTTNPDTKSEYSVPCSYFGGCAGTRPGFETDCFE